VHGKGLKGGVSTKQVLLVLGAGGGVGTAAVQIGKICGAIVIAAARYSLWAWFHMYVCPHCCNVLSLRGVVGSNLEAKETLLKSSH